jgi:hypothetical protein
LHGQERILRERFARLACVACGASHHLDDMLVLAQRGSRWLVLLTCWQCQRRGIFVASFPQPTTPREAADTCEPQPAPSSISPTIAQHWLIPSPTSLSDDFPDDLPGMAHPFPAHPLEDAPVTTGDVESVRHFLEGFNGDFRTLFGPSGGMERG